MSYCKDNGLSYVFGLAQNSRLLLRITNTTKKARRKFFRAAGTAQRVYRELRYRWLNSRSRSRRVVAKVEYLAKGENLRFVVTNTRPSHIAAAVLYEQFYCARGETENRIKEQRCTCLQIEPPRTRCAPISCGCGSGRRLHHPQHVTTCRSRRHLRTRRFQTNPYERRRGRFAHYARPKNKRPSSTRPRVRNAG
jgi:Transposase DDE domain group 1